MVVKRVENIEEIRAYMKVLTKLGHSAKQIFTALGEVYGSHNVLYETFRRWRKKFPLRKQAYSTILKISQPKNENFQTKILIFFHISAPNIDCGYSLEPPRRGGSNEYP